MSIKLIKCKVCGKEISKDAETCPHCGEPSPDIKQQKNFKSITATIFTLFLFFVLFQMCTNDEPETPAKEQAATQPEAKTVVISLYQSDCDKQKKHFPMTLDQYIDRYNTALSVFENKIQTAKNEENDNEEIVSAQFDVGQHIAIALIANSENRNLQSFTLVGIGDGTRESELNIMKGMVAAVMAIEDPLMPGEKRGEIVNIMGIKNGLPSQQNDMEFVRKNVKYKI